MQKRQLRSGARVVNANIEPVETAFDTGVDQHIGAHRHDIGMFTMLDRRLFALANK